MPGGGEIGDAEVLSLSVADLAAAIAARRLTAVRALRVFKQRAAAVDAALNAVTVWVPEAETWAEEADRRLANTGVPLGPLHGVPFTVKDHYAVKGLPITMGLRRAKQRAAQGKGLPRQDSAVVTALRAAGAIPFAKTNMTQLGETWGGGNPAYGDTLNPWDTLRTPGGSSCGEGALVGAAASPFGLGSDVGGSVRTPAAFCGICALKPTASRLTFAWEDGRTILNKPGDYGVLATCGPMAKRVDDLAQVCRALWAPASPMFRIDTRVPPLPFDAAAYADPAPLRIGYYTEEFTFPSPSPPVRRAMAEVVAALRAKGHDLVPFTPCSAGVLGGDAFAVVNSSLWGPFPEAPMPAGARKAEKKSGSYGGGPMAGEEVHPDLIHGKPPPAWMSAGAVEQFKVQRPRAIKDYQAAIARRDRLRDDFARAWKGARLDAVLCPAWAYPAPRVEDVRLLGVSGRSTQVYNFLDYPAGVVPVTRVTAADVAAAWDPASGDAAFDAAARRAVAGGEGLPVCVQLVAPPWREEAALRAMRAVEAAAGFDVARLAALAPVPRRSPTMGARPEAVAAKL